MNDKNDDTSKTGNIEPRQIPEAPPQHQFANFDSTLEPNETSMKPQWGVVHLQHDWAWETEAQEGNTVHLLGEWVLDQQVASDWNPDLFSSSAHPFLSESSCDVGTILPKKEIKQEKAPQPSQSHGMQPKAPSEDGEEELWESFPLALEDVHNLENLQDMHSPNPDSMQDGIAGLRTFTLQMQSDMPRSPSSAVSHETDFSPPYMVEGPSSRGTSVPPHPSSPNGRICQEDGLAHEAKHLDDRNVHPQLDSHSDLFLPDLPTMREQSLPVLHLSASPQHAENYLILHPDVLLTVTRVAASSRCVRRAVLQERMRDPDPAPSKAMVMGVMLHEVLQACLLAHTPLDHNALSALTDPQRAMEATSEPETWPWLGDFSHSYVSQRIAEQVTKEREVLYALGLPPAQAAAELHESVTPFRTFGELYLGPRRRADALFPDKVAPPIGLDLHAAGLEQLDVWGVEDLSSAPLGSPLNHEATVLDSRSESDVRARIRSVVDVEEEIWSPMWGLKGKVDATILVELQEGLEDQRQAGNHRLSSTSTQTKVTLAPLELKTGRAAHVLEHRAQTMLYTLLMSDRYGMDISAGFLYYSQSGQMHRVRRVQREVKALILARNALATYLAGGRGEGEKEKNPNIHPEQERHTHPQSLSEHNREHAKDTSIYQPSILSAKPRSSKYSTPPPLSVAFDSAGSGLCGDPASQYFTAPLPEFSSEQLKKEPKDESKAAPQIQLELEPHAWTDRVQGKQKPLSTASAQDVAQQAVNHVERMQPGLLPEPIDESFQCSKCYALDQCALYRTAHGVPLPTSNRQGMKALRAQIVSRARALIQSPSDESAVLFEQALKIHSARNPPESQLNVTTTTQKKQSKHGQDEQAPSIGLDDPTPPNVLDASLTASGSLRSSEQAASFFRKWDSILSLEHAPLAPARATLWTQTPAQRQKNGTALTDLALDLTEGPDQGKGTGSESEQIQGRRQRMASQGHQGQGMHRFRATFMLSPPGPRSEIGSNSLHLDPRGLMASSLSEGDAVVLSVPPQLLSVAQGYILSLTPDRIVVGLDHDLLPALRRARAEQSLHAAKDPVARMEDIRFVLDRDELAGGAARLRANLARLLLAPPPPTENLEETGAPRDIGSRGSHDISLKGSCEESSSIGATSRLRASIVHLAPPTFLPRSDATVQRGMSILGKMEDVQLNSDQEWAVEMVLRARDYTLVQGMPGTGKTTLIAVLCRVLVALGKKVLVAAYTHSALDTVLAKLVPRAGQAQPAVNLVRLGASAKVHPLVRPFTTEYLSQPRRAGHSGESGPGLEHFLSSAQVVGTTALGAHHPLLSRTAFDHVILDEAAQATLPAALGPILAGTQFTLVGDEQQLPPLVRSDLARQAGGETSLFSLLRRAHPQAVAPLRLQYRMNRAIMLLANELTYAGQLRCALPRVAEQKISLPYWSKVRTWLHRPPFTTASCPSSLCGVSSSAIPSAAACSRSGGEEKCWLSQAVGPELQAGLLDTDAVLQHPSLPENERENRLGKGCNPLEARLCAQLAAALVWSGAGGAQGEKIALVTPYRQQVGLLVRALAEVRVARPAETGHAADARAGTTSGSETQAAEAVCSPPRWCEHVEVLTADRAQGKDKAVVIVSMVRTPSAGVGQLLRDARRINVALTRAQQKLLVVGSAATLAQDRLLRRMVHAVPVVRLPCGADSMHAFAGGPGGLAG